MNLLSFLLILAIFFLPSRVAECENENAPTFRRISPVFEEMVGNQIYSLWQESIQKGNLKPEDHFFISDWQDEAHIAAEAVSSVQKKHEAAWNWRFRVLRDMKGKLSDERFQGVLIYDFGLDARLAQSPYEDFSGALSYIGREGNRGFLVVFVDKSKDLNKVESMFTRAGFKVHSQVSLPELEFLKDESGRQMVDLDSPLIRHRIYERLVREGMNPVHARPSADEAVAAFRNSNHIQLLILEKNI